MTQYVTLEQTNRNQTAGERKGKLTNWEIVQESGIAPLTQIQGQNAL